MEYKNSAAVKLNDKTDLVITADPDGNVESVVNLADNSFTGWKRLGGGTVTVNATTTGGQVAEFSAPELLDKTKIGYVRIRDKAGLTNGHCVGSDTFLNDFSEGALGVCGRLQYKVTDAGVLSIDNDNRTNTYGVYVYNIDAAGKIRIDAKKTATYACAGDFEYDIFMAEFPPGYTGIGEE